MKKNAFLLIGVLLVAVLVCVLAAGMLTAEAPESGSPPTPAESSIPPAESESPLPTATGALLPDKLATHLAEIADEAVIEADSSLQWQYNLVIAEWYGQSSLHTVAWTDAATIPAKNMLRMYAVMHFSERRSDEDIPVPAGEVEAFIRQYYAVTAQHLRSAENYDAASETYLFHGMDGLGSPLCSLTKIQRLTDTDYRLVLEYSETEREYVGYYHAFTIRVQDGRFHYVSGEGNVEYPAAALAAFWPADGSIVPDEDADTAALPAQLAALDTVGYDVHDPGDFAAAFALTDAERQQFLALLGFGSWQPVSITVETGFIGSILTARSPEGGQLRITDTLGGDGVTYPLFILQAADGSTGYFIGPARLLPPLQQYASDLRAQAE